MKCIADVDGRVRLLLLMSAMCLVAARSPAQDRIRMQIHDVSGLVFKETQVLPPRFGPISLRQDSRAMGNEGDDPIAGIELGDLVTNLKEMTDPMYWEGEGVSLSAEDSGLITVTCGESMHGRVDLALRAMRSMYCEPIVLELHLLPGDAIRGRKAILSREELDDLLQQAEPHAVLTTPTQVGQHVTLQSQHRRDYVDGVVMKAVQSATSPDPGIGAMLTGSAWRVMTRRGRHGAMKVYVWGAMCEELDEPASRLVPSFDRGGKQQMMTLHLPRYRRGEMLAQTVLHEGEGLLFGSNEAGSKACCVRIRRLDPAVDPFAPLVPADPTELHVRAYPVQDIVAGSMPGGPVVASSGEFAELDEDPQPTVVDEGRLIDLIKSTISTHSWDGSPFTITPQSGILFVRADTPTQDEVAALIEALAAGARRRLSVEMRYGRIAEKLPLTSTGDNIDRLAGDLALCCLGLAGKHGGMNVLAGKWTAIIRDYDAVLADDAATATPVVGEVFEGMNVSVDLVPVTSSQVRLRFRFVRSELDGPIQTIHLGDDRFGPLDLPKVIWSRTRELSPVVDLEKWTLLHMAPVEASTDHLAIVVRVREVR